MKLWVIVPAAGTGSRFGAEVPKQYQDLAGLPIIERTLNKLLSLKPEAIIVAVHGNDQRWQALPAASNPRVRSVLGRETRAGSVRAAIAAINELADPQDWVLVHDVARPCVRVEDIKKLLATLSNSPVGGILATPISDTVKQVEAGSNAITSTLDRRQLWAAQTPQLFRFKLLADALSAASESVTDEASAVESLGYTPVVVEGSRDNIKITQREDLAMAEAIIKYQENHP